MDKNLKIGPRADEKFWKTQPFADKNFEKMEPKKCWTSPSPHLRGDPPEFGLF